MAVEAFRRMCQVCGITPVTNKGYSKRAGQSIRKWSNRCNFCRGKNSALFTYRKYKKDRCEECGFVAKHLCQLDVDHIDGNSENNDPANLQTLCANCHRLKTYQNKDWQTKEQAAFTSAQLQLMLVTTNLPKV